MSTRTLSIALGMTLITAAFTVAAHADEHGMPASRAGLDQLVFRGEPDEVQAPRGSIVTPPGA